MADIEDHGVDEPLLEQAPHFLDAAAEAHAARAARVAALYGATRFAPRMKYRNDGIRGDRRARPISAIRPAHVCTNACCISPACSRTSRALS